jgi:hypothetical protein
MTILKKAKRGYDGERSTKKALMVLPRRISIMYPPDVVLGPHFGGFTQPCGIYLGL